jgi:tetratricopeptide (TPR) repeat protein
VPEVPGLEPFLPPVRYADGYAALRQGDLRLALDRFRDALAADPLAAAAATAPPRAPGAAAFRDGRLEEAREAFAAAVAQAPKDAEAHRLLGLVEAAGGRYAAAADALEKAVALDAGDERARLALADALARDGRAEAAAAVLEKTLADMPGSGRARYALGLLHRQEGRYLETLAELEQAVSHEPLLGRNSIYQTIAALRRSNLDLEGAIDAYAARAALTPNDAAAHQDLGEVHALLGEDAWAEAEFRVALLLDPARAAARTALAHVYLRDGRYEQAAEASREALAIDAGDREAHYVHATALVRLGKAEEGRQHLETYQRLLAEDAAARARGLELGRLRREAAVASARGDHAAAAALLEEALAYAPRAPESHLDLGLALLGAGRLPEAIERLSSAIALGAPPEAHLRLADAYDAAGRTDEGRRTRDAYASLKRDAIRRGEP